LDETNTTGLVDGQLARVATPYRGSYKGAVKAPIPKTLGLLLAVGLVAATGCAEFHGARLYHSGSEALDRGDPARAIADLERAAELAPHASEVRNHLGLAYAAAGRPDDAIASFEQALVLDCDNEAARHNLAMARSGRLGRAVEQP
jgi:tetratricopeptide (TPR) repeat protein